MKRLSTILIVMTLLIAVPIEIFAVSKPSQVKNFKASAKTSGSITLKWSKAKGAKGYEVQQYNTKAKKWKALKKVTALNYKHTKLKANTVYKYRVRAYTSYKQYYNTKTKKWVNKKPAANAWKTKTSRTAYVYGKASSALTERTKTSGTSSKIDQTTDTPTKPGTSDTPGESDTGAKVYTITWKNWDGSVLTTTSVKTGVVPTYSGTPTRPEDSANTYVFKGWTPSVVAAAGNATYTAQYNVVPKTPATKTVTDYLGKTRTITKVVSGGQVFWDDGVTMIKDSALQKWDRNVDGQFTITGGHVLENYHGATFDITEINQMTFDATDACSYSVRMYNGDANKFIIEPDSSITITTRDTFIEVGKKQYEPITKHYLTKNGYPIALTYKITDGDFVYSTTKSGNITTKKYGYTTSPRAPGEALGIWTDVFDILIKYDGKTIATKTVDTTADPLHAPNWTINTCNKMSPYRKIALDIAEAAIAEHGGSTGNVYQDFHIISEYIHDTYCYDEEVPGYGTSLRMNCTGGALVLETYSIIEWNKFGFRCGGSNYESGTHNAFVLDEYPYGYDEAAGHY